MMEGPGVNGGLETSPPEVQQERRFESCRLHKALPVGVSKDMSLDNLFGPSGSLGGHLWGKRCQQRDHAAKKQ